MSKSPRAKILFGLSGSIAAYKSCFLLSRLAQEGFEVSAVATRGALQFVGEATLEGLTGAPVFTDVYERGRMMDHIHLAQWADLFILAPASASAIARLAHGDASDALGALYLALPRTTPFLVAPAMNQAMFQHPAVQDNLAQLERRGATLLPTASGHQACGDVGPGRMLEPEQIFERILKALEAKARL